MLFNSLIFTAFLPLVFITYWLIKPSWRNGFLLLASWYFYFSYNPWFLLLLIGTSGFDYWCARQIDKQEEPKQKKLYLLLSLFSNLGVLFVFKYFVFFYNTGLELFFKAECDFDEMLLHQLIIPAGLSFYTFQSLSYTIDVYRGKYKASDSWSDFMLFVSFFPHMVAGPIVRYKDLMPQFKVRHYFKTIDWEAFAKLTAWGYFKKMVIADNLGEIVTPVFKDVHAYSGSTLLLAGFLFVVQVYCDFSGYSDIATGIAKLFKIDLTLNWRRPLFSKSLHEFWTRNHISITTWFRDYLYIGLGGNRVTYRRWLLNIFLVFLISGLWHGANFTFVIWGAMHGLVYIAEILARRRFPNLRVPGLIGWIYLIGFHTLSLIAFRALTVQDSMHVYKSIFTHFNPGHMGAELLRLKDAFYILLCALLVVFLFVKETQEEFAFIPSNARFTRYYLQPAFYILLVLGIFLLGNFKANTFIYFQF
ncbi:MAG: MBOAT family protein [Bacteroidetes bacterium]|nr:MBOAT family protein [Bacteroidota bacterium]